MNDLCARLPYDVTLMNICGEKKVLRTLNYEYGCFEVENENNTGNYESVSILTWKPCLRPMSSMTSEEEKHFLSLKSGLDYDTNTKKTIYNTSQVDWLNEHHFDYRGLIDKGLAIEIKNN